MSNVAPVTAVFVMKWTPSAAMSAGSTRLANYVGCGKLQPTPGVGWERASTRPPNRLMPCLCSARTHRSAAHRRFRRDAALAC
jgi:hypothetical protein